MHKNINLLKWFNFFTDFKLFAPIAILYFADISGSFALGMSIFSVAMVSAALFEIPTGMFSDFIGRRRTIILGAVSASLCVIFYAIGSNYWILVLGALFEGLSRSLYSGNNDALLHDSLLENKESDRFAEYFGKTSKMFQIALALSAMLGGIVLFKWDFTVIFWLSVIPQLLCLFLAILMSEPKIHSKKSGNIYLHLKEAISGFRENKKLRLLSLSSILSSGVAEASYQFQSAFLATVWPDWAVPFSKVLSNVGAAVSFHFSGRLMKRFNVFKFLIFGQVYTRSSIILAAIFPSIISPIIISQTSIFYGVLVVARNSLMQKEFKQEQRATMSSLNSFVGSILFGVVAILVGFTADKLSPAHSLVIIQLILFLNVLIFYKIFKAYR